MAYVDTVGDILRVTMAFTYPNGQLEETNFFLQCVVSGGSDSRAGMAAALDGYVVTDIVPHLKSTTHYYGSRWAIEQAAQKFGSYVTTPNTPGGSTDPDFPTQVRGLLQVRTALVGRRQRGRMYMPTPITTMGNPDGSPSSTYQGQIQAFANNILGGFAIGGSIWGMVLYHRPHPKATPPIPYTVTAVSAITASTKFATQRRSGQYGRVNVNPW
jgi:hypothetical protein